MKENNIIAIVEDSTEFYPTRFNECVHGIYISNGLYSLLKLNHIIIIIIYLGLYNF